ncbi:MAG: 50S ribosomal protein L9 [Tunicatimonas sp.]
MEIILKEDIKNLGYKDDIVNVKGGYGRNFLIPQGMAVIASPSNKKMIQENIRQAAHKADKVKKDAEEIAKKLEGMTLQIPAKAGETGKIFGSVTTLQISDALKEKGLEIERKRININSDIKTLGDYTAEIALHKEVRPEINIQVVEA